MGKKPFEDTNSWFTLAGIFDKMLCDPDVEDLVIVVDALDECMRVQQRLLKFIAEHTSKPSAKWVASSRDQSIIDGESSKARIELDGSDVSDTVNSCTDHKLEEPADKKKLEESLKKSRPRGLKFNANDTFA